MSRRSLSTDVSDIASKLDVKSREIFNLSITTLVFALAILIFCSYLISFSNIASACFQQTAAPLGTTAAPVNQETSQEASDVSAAQALGSLGIIFSLLVICFALGIVTTIIKR